MNTLMFRTAARFLVPLSLLFGLFVYFKGHQTPGGGFVAGLVTAVALIVHRMAEGRGSLRHMMILRERSFIGIGLALALVTAAVPLFMGLPWFTSAFGYLDLPGGTEPFEWASVMAFDLGVMMVVTGVVVGMINALSEETE